MHKFIAMDRKLPYVIILTIFWHHYNLQFCKGPSQHMALHCDCISVSVLGFGRISSCLSRELNPLHLIFSMLQACLRASLCVYNN